MAFCFFLMSLGGEEQDTSHFLNKIFCYMIFFVRCPHEYKGKEINATQGLPLNKFIMRLGF
jgi:hypothetical protein